MIKQLPIRGACIVYRGAGLPITLTTLLGMRAGDPMTPLRTAYADVFWKPETAADWFDLVVAICIWPVGLL